MNQTFTNEKGHLIGKVSFDKAEIQKATDKAINKLVLDVTVPGFRKGKAPKDKAVAYLSQSKLYDATINALLRQLDKNLDSVEEFHKYVEGRKFLNGVEPKVSLDKFTNDEAEFTVVWTLVPELTKLGEYKGLKTEVKQKRVLVKDVEAELKKLAEENAELVEAEKEAEMGDTVNIDFTGLMNGQAFEGGSAKSFDLELGSHRFVPAFEEQLITHKAGDKVDVAVTLPDNYPEPLTSKAVVFKVVINSVKVKELPVLDDEFVKDVSEFNTVDEYKEDVKKHLTERREAQEDNKVENALINALLENTTVDIPQCMIDNEVDGYVRDYEYRLRSQGGSLDMYFKYTGMTMEQLRENFKADAEKQVKTRLALGKVAKSEKLKALKKDLDAEYKKIASGYNVDVETVKTSIPAESISEDIVLRKAVDFIKENAVINQK